MKAYVFKRIDKLTDSWHSEGGLLIVAADEAAMRAMIAGAEFIEPTEKEMGAVVTYELSGEYEPRLFVFPDAGCC